MSKERLEEQTIALRAARELQDGWYVNLGFGIPTLMSNFIPEGRTIFFQAENGILGYGRIQSWEEAGAAGWRFVDGGGQPVVSLPGMSIFDFGQSFDMIRGGHLDLVILGALQVSEKGDLANWSMGKDARGGWLGGLIGGAMDLAIGAKRVYVTMTHTEKDDKPKILKKCTYPLTAKEVVKKIFTNISVIDVTKEGLVLKEVAPGWTAEEVQALTEPKLIVAEDLKTIEL